MKHEREIKDYELSVNTLAEIFLNKQFDEDEEKPIKMQGREDDIWWAGDDVGSTLFYGDWSFGFDDILTDIKEDAPKGEIIKYYDYYVRCARLKINQINYRSWLRGAPHTSNDALKHLERMKERLEKEINEQNGLDF